MEFTHRWTRPLEAVLPEDVRVEGREEEFSGCIAGNGVDGPGKGSPSAGPRNLTLTPNRSQKRELLWGGAWDGCHGGPGVRAASSWETVRSAGQQPRLRAAVSAGEARRDMQPSRRLLSAGESEGFLVSMVTVTVALPRFCAGFLGS